MGNVRNASVLVSVSHSPWRSRKSSVLLHSKSSKAPTGYYVSEWFRMQSSSGWIL